jgi:hypothetical protein
VLGSLSASWQRSSVVWRLPQARNFRPRRIFAGAHASRPRARSDKRARCRSSRTRTLLPPPPTIAMSTAPACRSATSKASDSASGSTPTPSTSAFPSLLRSHQRRQQQSTQSSPHSSARLKSGAWTLPHSPTPSACSGSTRARYRRKRFTTARLKPRGAAFTADRARFRLRRVHAIFRGHPEMPWRGRHMIKPALASSPGSLQPHERRSHCLGLLL